MGLATTIAAGLLKQQSK